MLRYDRQTKPGLVALYDIRPGNGVGPFLQPRSPHGAQHNASTANSSHSHYTATPLNWHAVTFPATQYHRL